MNTQNTHTIERAPIIAVMGHIDHGKSTLLSYIRKSNLPLNEAGGITQHISTYEVEHEGSDGKKHKITFVDTPGHEAFSGIRRRGASVADIAILVVSAEDGVKPQTLEALKSIVDSKTPFIVAINKIDKPEANVERTKQSLTENGIYIEGYGGDIPVVAISSKTGEGVPELLDMILLVAEINTLTGDPTAPGEGIIIENNRDIKKGISATCIIRNGTIKKGEFIVSGESIAPVRIMEDCLGKPLSSATFSSPVKIIGWDSLPEVGACFKTYTSRDEAHAYIEKEKENKKSPSDTYGSEDGDIAHLPIIIKADVGGSLEGMKHEIAKLSSDRIKPLIISSGIGTISENDVRLASGTVKAIIIGFNTKVDSLAKSVAERNEIEIHQFDIIYKMTDWLKETLATRTPKMQVDESTGLAKVLKVFSKVKDKQILGGFVEKGSISVGAYVKIIRRDVEVGQGKVRELQQQKVKTDEVKEGKEFGTMIESKIEIAQGDKIESFITIEK